jgi:hypothetical protein
LSGRGLHFRLVTQGRAYETELQMPFVVVPQPEPGVISDHSLVFLRSQLEPALCDSLVFSHALHLVGLSSTTVQQTFGTVSGPCPVVEQRCSIDGAPDFLIRRGAQDAPPTDCHCTELMYMIHQQSDCGLKSEGVSSLAALDTGLPSV